MLRVAFIIALAGLLQPVKPGVAQLFDSQSKPDAVATDYLFPSKNGLMITATSGVPYMGIAELSYGVSERFSVGAMIGRTFREMGYGLRMRGVVYENANRFRVLAKLPAFYYPGGNESGAEPWLLAWPTLHAEWANAKGVRLSVGMGLVGTACAADVFGGHAGGHQSLLTAGHPAEHGEEPSMEGIWNTATVGIAIPISKGLSFRGDLSGIFNGTALAVDNWIGGPPVILNLGVSKRF